MPRILIVDDAPFMRIMLKNIMITNGYEVIGEATTGVKAVQQFIELRPDLVTMDITMPDMDGITALKKIKEVDPTAIIVMCSSFGQWEMVVDAIKAGACDFIVKPFQEDRVVESLRTKIR